MSNSDLKVSVSNRKYTFSIDEETVETVIDRCGEPWYRTQAAGKALYSIMCELDAARLVLDACRRLGDDAPREIKQALAKHSRLVDDREPPSEWSR